MDDMITDLERDWRSTLEGKVLLPRAVNRQGMTDEAVEGGADPTVVVEWLDDPDQPTRRLRIWLDTHLDQRLWERLADLEPEERLNHPYVRMLHRHLLQGLESTLWGEGQEKKG